MEIVKEGNVITLVGVINSENVSEIEMQIMHHLNSVDYLLIDIDGVKQIESSGLFMFFLIKKKARLLGKTISFEGTEVSSFNRSLKGFSFFL